MCGQRQEGGKEMVMSRLKEELEELEEDVKLQTEINGITLNSCTTKTLQNSKSRVSNHSLHCHLTCYVLNRRLRFHQNINLMHLNYLCHLVF